MQSTEPISLSIEKENLISLIKRIMGRGLVALMNEGKQKTDFRRP